MAEASMPLRKRLRWRRTAPAQATPESTSGALHQLAGELPGGLSFSLCPVCGGPDHPEAVVIVGNVTVPRCPNRVRSTTNRYLEERRELVARGVYTRHLPDGIFDDLIGRYGSRHAAVEALAASPRPVQVVAIAGQRHTTKNPPKEN